MEFYIKTIRSTSEYFSREDNNFNSKVIINITKEDESGKEPPKHLIITGINGTGKTVLLYSIYQVLRKKYVEITKKDITLAPNEAVSTELTYCNNLPKYFESLFVTVEHMFKPSIGLDNNDYLVFFIEISKNSEPLRLSLERSLKILYEDDFESLNVDTRQIKLKNRCPFSVSNMASGHYSFLNIFCCIRFCQLGLQWEENTLLEYVYKELSECLKISNEIVDKLGNYIENDISKYSRYVQNLINDEQNRLNNIKKAHNVVKVRYEEITKNGFNERLRARDVDVALGLSRAKQVSENELFLKNENVDILFDILQQKETLDNKLGNCLNRLLNNEINEKSNPLIILIDEPEIHLYVALQKRILPYLEKCFPNSQFIVATHSPFIITSLKNATLFNLDNRETLNDDLTRYSYKNVIEEWFDIYSCSDEAKIKYAEFKKLACCDKKLSSVEKEKYVNLYSYLIKTDLISSVSILNLQKQIMDGEIYVSC